MDNRVQREEKQYLDVDGSVHGHGCIPKLAIRSVIRGRSMSQANKRTPRWIAFVVSMLAVTLVATIVLHGQGNDAAVAEGACTSANDLPPETADGPEIDGDAGGEELDIDALTYTVYRRGYGDEDARFTLRLSDPNCMQLGLYESQSIDGALRSEASKRTEVCDAISQTSADPGNAPEGFNFTEAALYIGSPSCALTGAQSLTSAGMPATAYPRRASSSAMGWGVAFSSNASTIVEGDANGVEDIFLRDNRIHRSERISVSTEGGDANGPSMFQSISGTGQVVAFMSYASNLVSSDPNGAADVFVRDRYSGSTMLASRSTAGAFGNGPSGATGVSLSADGSRIAFSSSATNLLDGVVTPPGAVYLRDLTDGTTKLVSRSMSGTAVPGNSPALSPDGRYVAFSSSSPIIVTGDTNAAGDVFVYDLVANTTRLVSAGPNGAPANGWSDFPAISSNGRNVAFESTASNLTADPPDPLTAGTPRQVYLADLLQGWIRCLSLNIRGERDRANSLRPSTSFSGRYIVFESQGDDLVVGDTNVYTVGGPADVGTDIFLFDLESGQLAIVDVDSAGVQGSGASHAPSLSPEGSLAFFSSTMPGLAANDTNLANDVFARRLFQ